jgi:hypothetical protein
MRIFHRTDLETKSSVDQEKDRINTCESIFTFHLGYFKSVNVVMYI